ncbi:hypothetical protein [Flavobacterium sp. Root186]|uniref:hypothetical protein n=1 Tax=Flavobacterium sp. Root186 TaxID=1736485 RepID=UPI0006FF1A9E|nr:hypothetical protein [Flavobacterium sp. Root186]KRB54706.1 hypothetical protein ASD98_16835 [Flavobacterium sp. Root186]
MENNNTFSMSMFIKHYEEEYNTQKMLFLIENPSKTVANFIENKIEELNQKELEYKRKCNLSDEEVYQEIKQTTKVRNYINKGFDKTHKKDFDESLESDFLEFRKKYTLKEKKEDSLLLKFYKTKLKSLASKLPINEQEPEVKTPYKIALLAEIGFFNLSVIKKLSNENKYKIVQQLIGGTLRSVKGNILVLNPESNEDRTKYTANNHSEDVKDYLDKLK